MIDQKQKILGLINDLKARGVSIEPIFMLNNGAFIKILFHNGEFSEVVCSDRTNWKFMCGKNCLLIGASYRPGSYISNVNAFIDDVVKVYNNQNDPMSYLLSINALNWLKSIDYGAKTHDERMILISAAKIAYPN